MITNIIINTEATVDKTSHRMFKSVFSCLNVSTVKDDDGDLVMGKDDNGLVTVKDVCNVIIDLSAAVVFLDR